MQANINNNDINRLLNALAFAGVDDWHIIKYQLNYLPLFFLHSAALTR